MTWTTFILRLPGELSPGLSSAVRSWPSRLRQQQRLAEKTTLVQFEFDGDDLAHVRVSAEAAPADGLVFTTLTPDEQESVLRRYWMFGNLPPYHWFDRASEGEVDAYPQRWLRLRKSAASAPSGRTPVAASHERGADGLAERIVRAGAPFGISGAVRVDSDGLGFILHPDDDQPLLPVSEDPSFVLLPPVRTEFDAEHYYSADRAAARSFVHRSVADTFDASTLPAALRAAEVLDAPGGWRDLVLDGWRVVLEGGDRPCAGERGEAAPSRLRLAQPRTFAPGGAYRQRFLGGEYLPSWQRPLARALLDDLARGAAPGQGLSLPSREDAVDAPVVPIEDLEVPFGTCEPGSLIVEPGSAVALHAQHNDLRAAIRRLRERAPEGVVPLLDTIMERTFDAARGMGDEDALGRAWVNQFFHPVADDPETVDPGAWQWVMGFLVTASAGRWLEDDTASGLCVAERDRERRRVLRYRRSPDWDWMVTFSRWRLLLPLGSRILPLGNDQLDDDSSLLDHSFRLS